MLRDSQGALADFKAAIKLSPHTAHMYFNRGNLYASMDQFDQAEKDYSKGRIFWDYFLKLGRVYIYSTKYFNCSLKVHFCILINKIIYMFY